MAKKITIVIIMLCLVILAGVLVLVFSQGSCPTTNACVPLQECYDRHKDVNALNNTLLFGCSDRAGYVCCPEIESVRPVGTLISMESKKSLLPTEDCGFSSGVKISEGQAADLGQFPWMVLLAFKVNGSLGTRNFLCGGTLISKKYVLTAAHCMVTENGFPVSVRLGEHDLLTDEDCTDYCADPPVDVEVEKVIMHENYNKPFLKNDIALIRLKTSAPRTTYIGPICMPFGLNITGNEDSKKYTIAGWGKLEHVHNVGSDSLQFTTILSTPVSECNEEHPAEVRPIGDLQLCAGGIQGQDACKGDSGGPLMETKLDVSGTIRTYQVGVISFGNIPCGKNEPSVYTRLTAYLNWILSHLEP